jgi:hypothetical protein
MNRRKRIYLGTALALAGGFAFAFPVEDPVQWAATAVTTSKIVQEIQQLIAVERNVQGTWNQLQSDAQYIRAPKSLWRGYFMSPVSMGVGNQSGETDGWFQAINQGLGIANARARIFVRLTSNPGLIMGSNLAATYANAEIGSSATASALQTVGTAKSVQRSMETPIGHCENSALSTSASNNTAAANGNIANGCQALILRQGETALAVDTSRLELETYAAKRQTDQDTNAANVRTADQKYRSAMTVGDTAAAVTSIVDR